MTGVPRLSGLWLGLALSISACATDVGGGSPGTGGGQAGSGQSGAAGGAGNVGTAGAAGTSGPAGTAGGAGTVGPVGAAGASGSTGTPGSAGTSGAGGAISPAGTGGSATGRGGTTGSAGAAGNAGATGGGGRGGTTGSGGRGGTTGSAGTNGTAGTTGSGGSGDGEVNLNGRKALLVVDNPGSLDNGEIILQLTLANRGMIVTVGASTGPATLANGQNVVIVSSSAGSGDFVPIYKDVAVPMIVFGNSAYSNLGWITSSSGKGSVNSTTLVSLGDANPALDSDVMSGVGFKMILDSRSTSLYWGTPGPSGIKVASIMGQATQLVEFAYEKGAALPTGTAPARRVGFGVKIDSIQDVTVEGFKLLMSAVEWTAGP